MSDLPTDREKALEAIAKGWGRKPTLAHPDCVCGKPIPGSRSGLVDHAGEPIPRTSTAKDCPVHRPDVGSSRQG